METYITSQKTVNNKTIEQNSIYKRCKQKYRTGTGVERIVQITTANKIELASI